MFAIRSHIIYIILIHDFVNSLVELPEADNDIAISERIIRDTVSRLLATFRIRSLSQNPRLKALLMSHNFFLSITLKDCFSLKKIVKLTKVNIMDKNTEQFISLINEILDEGEHSNDKTDEIFIKTYIFIKRLRDLKMTFDYFTNFNINTEILKQLHNDGPEIRNYTEATDKIYESNDNVSRNYEFWKPNARRIYRGQRTRIKKFPFMASVQFFNRFQCGGSIIKSDLVITSSSCLQLAWNNRFFRENPAFLSVRIGSVYSERGGENIPVLEVYFHPEYDPKSLRHNLAIMRLTKRIHFSRKRKVKKIDFDRDPSPLSEITNGITVLGWGAYDNRNYVRSRKRYKLLYDKLDIYPLRECRDVYSKAFVTRKHFCAGYFSKGGGACNRDAGGPGIVNDKLMGVISFGSLYCGAVDAPTVFTKLGYYTDWIEEIMEQDPPHTYKKYEPPPNKTRLYSIPTSPTTFKVQPVGLAGTTASIAPLKDVDYLRVLRKIDHYKNLLSVILKKNNEVSKKIT